MKKLYLNEKNKDKRKLCKNYNSYVRKCKNIEYKKVTT